MVLLIEDDEEIATLLQKALPSFEMAHVMCASDALLFLEEHKEVNAIILDLTLPDMDGLQLCKKIRKLTSIPIIISSARGSIEDKMKGLAPECANDYIVKPYDPRELELRLNNLLPTSTNSSSQFSFNFEKKELCKNGVLVSLTEAEYEIFKLLYFNQNRCFTRSDIANTISSHSFESTLESINVLLSKIRKKIDDKDESYIITRRNVGYCFNEKI
ncbi:response regulator transcription factor [uncultured Sulfurimonas sp.]|jgi:two-component system, OmpR family, response regulator|uniref:response regulator transcription factor n=1 Tax=uncultured Sulfurimonas sp. TaxID=291845 RepID=UPI0032B116CC